MPPSAMMTPPRINRGTARIGVELALEKALFRTWTMEPPLSNRKIGAAEPRIMETPMGTDTAIHTRNTINTSNAASYVVLPSAFLPALVSASAMVCSTVLSWF